MEGATRVRIDKWLWAARFYKTRALATHAIELGRVLSRSQTEKPAREVHVGDLLQVTNDAGVYEVEVLALSDRRGPATVARTLYSETAAGAAERQRTAEARRLMPRVEALHLGRPGKRDRREMVRLRGR
jgi:ribosome-associated heat shock protein Hsp15